MIPEEAFPGRPVLLQVDREAEACLEPVLRSMGADLRPTEARPDPGTLAVLAWEPSQGRGPLEILERAGADLLLVVPDRRTETLEAAYAAGATDVLARPFLDSEVRARLRLHLRLSRLQGVQSHWLHADPVTGLPDRDAFSARMGDEWLRAARTGEPMALAVAEADGTWAREGGCPEDLRQARLMALAHAIRQGARRAEDGVAREADGTFLMLLPDSDVPAAHAVALSVLSRVRLLSTDGALFSLDCLPSLSIGFAAGFPGQYRGPEELLEKARGNLLRAKARGGNRWSSGEED